MTNRELKSTLRILAGLQKHTLARILDTQIDEIWCVFDSKGMIHGLLSLENEQYDKLLGYCSGLVNNRTSMKIENFRKNDLVQFDPLYVGYAKCIGTVKQIHHEYNSMIVEIQNTGINEKVIEVECSPDEVRFCGVAIFV
jgi:hypothetical protein